MKLPLQILASIALLLALVTSAGAQQEDGLRGREGDEVRAQAANRAAQARIRNLCVSLDPVKGQSITRRSKYPDWVKQLICRYMVADFTTAASRNAYVARVLNALRANSNGAWRFANRAPVAHIVTEDPAYVYQPDPEKSGVLKRVKKSSILRSLASPASSAIGIHQALFATPPARTLADAKKRIPKSEDVIQQILMMAIVADMLAGTKNSISKKKARRRIKAGLKYFQKNTLTAAKIPKIGGAGFGPRPAANVARGTVENYRLPDETVGKNVLARAPGARSKSIKITRIKRGQTAGLTRSVTGFVTSIKSDQRAPEAAESIEPEYKFKKNWVLTAIIRTFIAVETFFGVPQGKKAARVMGQQGKDCTPTIRNHENQHVDQFWEAWRSQVILPISKDLKDQKFKDMKAMSFRVYAAPNEMKIFGTNMNVVYLDIVGFYLFPNETTSTDARKVLYKKYKKAGQNRIRNRFLKSVDELSDRYHLDIEVGLDDNCNPVKDAKLAKASLGKLGKSKSKKPKDIEENDFRRPR